MGIIEIGGHEMADVEIKNGQTGGGKPLIPKVLAIF